MEVIKLPEGQAAPQESDCISIDDAPGGMFSMSATALQQCGEGEGEEIDSDALIGGGTYQSYDEAEAAGLAWASEHCADTVYISRNAPLPE
jgi:hypothetical protein